MALVTELNVWSCPYDACVVAAVQQVTCFFISLMTCLACCSRWKHDSLTCMVRQSLHLFSANHRI